MGCHLWGRTESDMTEATWQQQQQRQLVSVGLEHSYLDGKRGEDVTGKAPCMETELGISQQVN